MIRLGLVLALSIWMGTSTFAQTPGSPATKKVAPKARTAPKPTKKSNVQMRRQKVSKKLVTKPMSKEEEVSEDDLDFARIIRSRDPKNRIPPLAWNSLKTKVLFREQTPTPTPYVILRGRMSKADFALTYNQSLVVGPGVRSKDEFGIDVSVKGKRQFILLKAIGPLGNVYVERAILEVPKYNELMASKNKAPKDWFANAALGFSSIDFSQSDLNDGAPITFNALSFRLAGRWFFAPPFWDAAANFYINVLPFNFSGTAASIQFFGANLRAGFIPPWPRNPWILSLMAGFGYYKMLVSDNFIGYSDILNIQLYPVLRRSFSGGQSAYVYFKLVPGVGVTNFNLQFGEKATGIGYVQPLPNGHSLIFSFDFSFIKVPIDQATFSATSYTLNIAYGI